MESIDLKPPAQDSMSISTSLGVLESLKPSPVLRLHLDDLSHPATAAFLTHIDSTQLLSNAISQIITHLYAPLHTNTSTISRPKIHIPPTRSVTLVVRSMDGVAYTTGLPLDSDHKEIHLSLTYIVRFLSTPRFTSEVTGVLTHEMVHAYQYDAYGSCPGGLIEGIADYVRLRADLAPPHWNRNERMDKWDEGYQRTAYFLEWLEGEYGAGTVARINAGLREEKYESEKFWTGIFGPGRDVGWLFKKFRESLKKEEIGAMKERSAEDGVCDKLVDA